jgi:diguanylate cyclase (GGDEF)-like protein
LRELGKDFPTLPPDSKVQVLSGLAGFAEELALAPQTSNSQRQRLQAFARLAGECSESLAWQPGAGNPMGDTVACQSFFQSSKTTLAEVEREQRATILPGIASMARVSGLAVEAVLAVATALGALLIGSAFLVYRSSERQTQAEAQTANLIVELTSINEFSNALHLCVEPLQALKLVACYLNREFWGARIAISRLSDSREIAECMLSETELVCQTFPPERCCAFRGGRMHIVRPGFISIGCEHFQGEAEEVASYICVPMSAYGEIVGLIHIVLPDDCTSEIQEPQKKRLTLIAEQAALSLSNLFLRDQLSSQSIHDPLTGLFNRRHMERVLNSAVEEAAREEREISVLLLDLDHFKSVNDRFGHAVGDELLKRVARAVRSTIREQDVACRYGGEEIVVLLKGCQEKHAALRAEDLREAISRLKIPNQQENITCSIGISVLPEDGRSANELLRAADSYLYEAKRRGRNRCVSRHTKALAMPDGGSVTAATA